MGSFFFIWRGRVLFIGPIPPLALHTHLAAAVCFGLNAPLELHSNTIEAWSTHDVALIPPRTPHALRVSSGPAAFLFLDPGSAFYERLFTRNDGYHAMAPEAAHTLRENVTTLIRNCEGNEPDDIKEILERIPSVAMANSGDSLEALYGDPRIAGVVREILDAPEEAPPVEQLAARAGMSASRLAHVFRDRVGIPIRALRTWFRLKTAVIWFKRGYSLTDAALMAGFYDSPHFARKFKEMFGISPSLILNRRSNIFWHIEGEELSLELGGLPTDNPKASMLDKFSGP